MSTTLDLLRAADLLIQSCEGLEPEAMDTAISAWMDGAADKAAALQAVVARAEAQAAFLDGEANAVLLAAKRQTSVADRCRSLIVALLRKQSDLGEGSAIHGPGWSMSLRKTEAVDVTDPTAIPADYLRVRTTSEPDKAAIKEAIGSGTPVPGASVVIRHSVTIRKAGK